MTPEEIGAIRAMRLERAQRRADPTGCPLFSDSATPFFLSPFRFTGSHYTGHTAASTSKTRLTPPSTPCRSRVMKRKVTTTLIAGPLFLRELIVAFRYAA